MSDGYQVRPFRAADYVTVYGAMLASGGPALVHDPVEVSRAYEGFSVARTVTHDGVVLGCAGLLRKWEGLAEAWLLIDPAARERHGLVVARMVKRELGQMMQPFRRIEADVLEGWALGLDFVAWLGFHVESVMRAYGPRGETFVKCVIIRDSNPARNE
jgi:hypothetical protein